MFRNSEKTYNLSIIIERLKKALMKKYNNIDKQQLDGLVNTIAIYHKNQFKFIPNRLYQNQDKEFIDLALEDSQKLATFFNISNLYQLLKVNTNSIKQKYAQDDNFRREIMNIVLYEIIEQGGKDQGAEYGLVFAKTFNFNLAIPMHYATYDGTYDYRFLKFYDVYKNIGGSLYVNILPNYYTKTDKSRYYTDDLSELAPELDYIINNYKVNSKK